MGWKKIIAINKWRIILGYQWIGTLGIGLVISKTIQDIIKKYWDINILIIYPLACFSLWVCGYVVEKLGLFSEETNYSTKKNPFFTNWRKEK